MADINNDQTNPLEGKSLSDFGYTPFGGNSQSASNTPAINASNFNDIDIDKILDEGIKNNVSSLSNPSSQKGTNSVDSKMPVMQYANAADIERFAYQTDFNGSGFNPFDSSNNERWIAKETWSSALSKGFDSFGEKFGQTFSDYWKDYGRMTSALATMDADELLPDAKEMMEQNYAEHISSMKNYVFIPEEDEDAIFSKRSISEFVGNAGFAMGTMTAFATELAADALITVATAGGGAGAFGLTAGRLAAKIGTKIGVKAGKEVVEEGAEALAKKAAQEAAEAASKNIGKGNFFTGIMLGDESLDVIKATDNIKRLNHMTKDKTMMREMKNAFTDVFGNVTESSVFGSKFLNKAWDITKGVPLAGTALKYGEKTVAAARAGRGFGETAGVAFKGLRRLGQEYNLAASEASFEGVTTYGSTLEKMIENHNRNSDEPLTAGQLSEMKKIAGEAAFKNYGTNMAILLASNKLQFGNLFSKMPGLTKFSKELIEESGEQFVVKRAFGKTLQNVAQSRVYDKSGFLGLYGQLGKISNDFGKKQALLEVGKSLGKGLLKFQGSEGLQENFQEMSSSAWTNYYSNRYNGVYMTLEKAFEQGAAEQFTAQGFKTFLQGAFTGTLIGGPVHALQYGMQKTNEYAASKYYQAQGQGDVIGQSKKARIDNINLLNSFFESVENNTYDNTVLNFTNQMNAAMDATEAAAENKDYEFVNAKDNALIQAAVAANKLDQIDALTSSLKRMGQTMSQEEFESAFKVKLSDTRFNSVQEFTNDVADKLENYSNRVDEIRNRVKHKLVDPFQFKANSADFINASITRKVQEDFINILAINNLKSQRSAERAKSVFESYNSISDLASSSDYVYRVLTSAKNLQGEIGNISGNIKILEESLNVEGISAEEKAKIKEQIKDQQEELNTLQEWRGFWGNRDFIVNEKEEFVNKEGEVLVDEKGNKIKPEVLDVFVGTRSKEAQSFKQDNGTIEKKYTYNASDKKVKEVFEKLINIKNKQAGFETTVSVENFEDGFQKVVDFIQLDSDARDYMEASEALNSPESYQATIKRMHDGKFKAYILFLVDSISQRVEVTVLDLLEDEGKVKGQLNSEGGVTYVFEDFDLDEFKKIRDNINKQVEESEPFKNLLKLAITKELGLDQQKYAEEQMKALEEVLKKTLKENLKDHVSDSAFDDAVSDDVYNKFKADPNSVPEDVIESIAQRIYKNGTKSLSAKEKEIYDNKSARIDIRVAALSREGDEEKKSKQTPNAPVTNTEVLDDAFINALNAISPTVVNGIAGFTTDYTDVDGVVNSVFGVDEQSVISQLEQYRARDEEKLKSKTESQTPPVQGTDFIGDIPSDEQEGADTESEAQSVKSQKDILIDELKLKLSDLITLQAEGKTTTPEGVSIDAEIQRIATEITDLQNQNKQELDETKTSSEITQEESQSASPDLPIDEIKAEDADTEEEDTSLPTTSDIEAKKAVIEKEINKIEKIFDEKGKKPINEDFEKSKKRLDVFSKYRYLTDKLYQQLIAPSEITKDKIDSIKDEFYKSEDYKKIQGEELKELLLKEVEAYFNKAYAYAQFKQDLKDIKDAELAALKSSKSESLTNLTKTQLEYLDNLDYTPLSAVGEDGNFKSAKIPLPENGEVSYTDEELEELNNIYKKFPELLDAEGNDINWDKRQPLKLDLQKKIIERVKATLKQSAISTSKEIATGKDLPVEVKDESGDVITTVNTETDAEILKQKMENNLKDHVFIKSILTKLKLDPSLQLNTALIEGLREQMTKAMEAYNAENEGVPFSSLESFYNSNRKTKIALNKIIKKATNADVQVTETEVATKKVTSKPKNKQSTADIITETVSLTFNEAVQQLHNDLMALEDIPTTTQKTEQIAIIFPEGTTDFTKFVNTSIEDIALNKLKDIKVSCKQ